MSIEEIVIWGAASVMHLNYFIEPDVVFAKLIIISQRINKMNILYVLFHSLSIDSRWKIYNKKHRVKWKRQMRVYKL